ncbi:MAG: XRE family transcriptional regulator [Pedobacter sp.]|nr:MAG: XRE family transcriptional regulator [Pedobacter sp.]
MSRKDIACLLKVDTCTIRAWENGINMPSQKKIDEIEALLQWRH